MGLLQKLLVNDFEWIKDISQFNEDFMKNYNEENNEGYFLEVDVQYLEKLHERHNNLSFLPEWMKIEIVEKLEANLHDKTKYVIHIRNLKQELNHRSVLKKVHRVLKFNQNACLKPHIDMNTDLRKKAQNDFEKDFFKLMKFFFGKAINYNIRKHRDMTTERRTACYNRKTKKLFGVRTKLSYYKYFQRKFVSNRYERNRDTYE